MDLLKIFLLTLTILLGCIRDSKTMEYNEIKYQNQKEANAANSLTCPCFPKNPQGKHISELFHQSNKPNFSPIGLNQKRLVVYIYKTNNDDLTIYVPNKGKQIVFPDLTLDEGDNLRIISTEKVIDLYDINSDLAINSIAKEVKEQEIIDDTLQPDFYLPSRNPTDLWTTIHHDNFETNNYDDDIVLDQAGILEFFKKYPSNSDLILPEDLLVFPSVPEQIFESETNSNHPSISDFPIYADLSLYSTDPAQISASDTSTNYPNNNDIFSYDDLKAFPSASGQISESDTSGNYKNLIDFILDGNVNLFPLASGQISKSEINKNQQSVSDLSLHKDQNIFLPILEEIAVPIKININPPSISNSLLQRELNVSPTAAAQIKAPEIVTNSDTSSIYESDDLTGIPVPPDYTIKRFEQWFKGNKNFIGNTNLPFLQTINQGKFYIILLKALNENGINISETGNLIDWSGNILDISKLKLLPVILGDNIDLKNLLSQNKCFTPFNLSFLQGILVTLTYPPRILGVIPLGKILEETAQYTNQPCYLASNKAPSCEGGSCQMKTMTNQNENIIKETDRTKVLDDVFDSKLSDGDIKRINKPVQDFSEDDMLGLRIIGGKPATSSGTPVSSKGRSADV